MKHRKNCECCPVSLLIVKSHYDCHKFRFSTVFQLSTMSHKFTSHVVGLWSSYGPSSLWLNVLKGHNYLGLPFEGVLSVHIFVFFGLLITLIKVTGLPKLCEFSQLCSSLLTPYLVPVVIFTANLGLNQCPPLGPKSQLWLKKFEYFVDWYLVS